MEKVKGKEKFNIQMEIIMKLNKNYLRVNLKMIIQKDMDFIYLIMVINIKLN